MRAIDPITITTSDGQERKFLLSMGGIRRLKTRFGVKQIKDLLDQDAEAAGVPILWEALLEKGALTEEGFADLLPARLEDTIKAVMRLLGASFPERPENPPSPNPAIQ